VASLDNLANIIFRHEYQDAGFASGMAAGAAAAEKAAAAGEKVADATQKTTAEVTRALPAWQTVNKAVDENAKLAAATERANNKLAAQLASLRAESAKNAEVAANAGETERRLTALRDAAVARATQQAAQERERWAGVTTGAANASGAMGSLSRVAGSAGQQLQDVVVQAQMGTSAFTILAQQGSQFLSGFGPGGAAAGAALAIGAVALGALGLIGNIKSLDEAVKESAANFARVTSAAEDRVKGFKDEAEAIDKLATSYAAMGTAAAAAERVVLARQQKQIGTSADTLTESLGGRLASDLRQQQGGTGPAIGNFEDVTGLANSAAKLAPDLTAAVEAFRQFRDVTGPTVEGLRAYIGALDDASRAGGGNNRAIVALRDSAIDAMPKVADLEKAMRQNAEQAAALRLAAGESAESLIAAGAAANTAAGGFNALAPGIVAAARALQQMRKDAADDPLRAINAEASRVADLTAALRNGGIPAYERFKDTQDAAAAAQKQLAEVTKDYIASRAPLIGQDAALADAATKRAGWAQDIERAAQAQRDLSREVDTTRKAEEAAEAAAKRAATAAEAAAKKAADAQAEFDRNHYSEPTLTDNGPLLSLGTSDEKAQAVARRNAAAFTASQKDLVQAAREGMRDQQAEAKTATDNVVRYTGDAFANLFSDNKKSWGEMWTSFLGTARAALARIAAEAIIRPIIAPIIAGLMGGGSGSIIGGIGSALGIGAGPTLASGAAPGLGLGSIGSAYSLNQGITSGMGAFAPGGRSTLGIGVVDNTLNTPISSMTTSAGEEAFRTSAGLSASPSYTVGNALGAGASIVGGGLSLYQGIQRGGVGGGVQATGGAIGIAAGATSAAVGAGLLSASSTLAMLGPYGMIAAAVLAIVSQFLPGAKPSNMSGTSAIDLASGQIDTYGAGGDKYSQGNRDAATSAAQGVGAMASNLSRLLGGAKIGGRATVDVGNRDGIAARFITAAGADSDTWHFSRDDTGNADMQKFLVMKMLESVATSLPAALAKVVSQIPHDTAEGIVTALAKVAAVTNGGSFSANQAIAANHIDFGNVDQAVSELQWVSNVYEPLVSTTKAADAFHVQLDQLGQSWLATIEHANNLGLASDALTDKMTAAATDLWTTRNKAVANATTSLEVRYNRATWGNDLADDLREFDIGAGQQRDTFRKQLEDWGVSAEVMADQMFLLERTLGAERLKITKDYNDQIIAAEETRAGKAAGIVKGLADYARGLRTGTDSPLSAQEQYFGASSDFFSDLGKVQGGDGDALARITTSADTFLKASRAVYGSGSGYATDYSRVLDAIGNIASMEPAQLTAVIYQTEMRTQTQVLNDSLVLLRDEVVALRREVQLNGAATGRAAA
jgi:hypothetical protein